MNYDYHLPSGKKTKRAQEFLREWKKIYEPIQKALKVDATAFDPGIRFVSRSDLKRRDSFTIPTEFAEGITKIIKQRDALKRKVRALEQEKVRKYHERG